MAPTATAVNTRDLFRNDSGGWQGVVTIEPGGNHRAISVAPGDDVWLTEEEQVLTANAPRTEGDNPLINGALVCISEAAEVKNRRPLRPGAENPEPPVEPPAAPTEPPVEETGAPPLPAGDPVEGERAPGEEVGTPEAAAEGGMPREEKPADPPLPNPGEMRTATTQDDPTRPQPPKDQLPRPVARRG